ncbi:MAG: VWA domain-containing protein [Chitinophagales bacterium]|nr:VWA domain-containing protein [Chitinophagales bacterium]
MNYRTILFLTLSLFLLNITFAQDKQKGPTRILFLLDASASMKKDWDNRTRWEVAKQILTEITDSLNNVEGVEFGLRVYGHQSPSNQRDCQDSKLEVNIGTNNAHYIQKRLAEIKPKGITPIAYSLEKSAFDFPTTAGRNILILITDGEESCSKDLCEISKRLQKSNAILKPFIIGLNIPDYIANSLECVGQLHQTEKPGDFKEKLDIVLNRALAQTTVQVNLLDTYGKPTETNVNLTFHDSQTEIAKYNFYHTINHEGNPDTLAVDPVYNYDIVVHTIPSLRERNIKLEENKHNVIDIPAAQGSLRLEFDGPLLNSTPLHKIKCLIKESGEYSTLHIQPMNSIETYLTGKYDLEFLTLPRIKLQAIEITQSYQKMIKVPAPGSVNLLKSFEVYGGIFIVEKGRMKKIYELRSDLKQENIALQPGKYRIVYRAKNSKTMHTTVDKEFEVLSGKSLNIKL